MFNRNVLVEFLGRPAKLTAGEFLKRVLLFAPILFPMAVPAQSLPTATLPGHVLGILPNATPLPRDPAAGQQPLTLGVLLNLSDQAGFDAFGKDFKDPNSPNYHKTIGAADLAARFGPTQEAYDSVLAYLQQYGLTLVVGSANRRTITVKGTRAQAEAAFHVNIDDYQLGSRTFHTVANDPAVPTDLAPLIHGVMGLSNLAQWRPALSPPSPQTPASVMTAYNAALTPAGSTNTGGLPPGINGSDQTIGLIEFDNFVDSDVSNWLAFAGLPAKLIKQVSRFAINGGTTPSGCNPSAPQCGTTEVLLDIAAALGTAPGANVVVFDSPVSTDFYTTISLASNQLYLTGGGILSMSWFQCEAEISSSDASGVDSLLAEDSYTGVTFFSATGDSGGSCTSGDGSVYPNSISFPSDSTSAVAVGGTTLQVGDSNEYQSESWWLNGGGFGVSQYIFPALPDYQSPFTSASGRSIPDVSMDANPNTGIGVCQAYGASSPNCFLEGGTSLAAPLWAGVWALASQAQVDAAGYVITSALGTFYQYPSAFHKAASMTGAGDDFSHVGLGSPDVTSVISRSLTGFIEVDSVSPDKGPWEGGTTVTIHGKGFVGVKKVTFGGVDATHVTIYSDSKLTAESPAASGDQVDIQVVTPAGDTPKSSKDLFTYSPVVTKVSPNSGPAEGGTSVKVTGKGFSVKSTSFEFGGTVATKIACSSSTDCTMDAPSHDAGTVDVTAETSGGTSPSSPDDHFTFEPSISAISPSSGPLTGTPVTVKGHGLDGSSKFDFGGSPATGIACASSTSCTMTAPAHSAGVVDVIVETSGAKSSAISADRFTYLGPAITGVSPNVGPTVGGQSVKITGVGLDDAMTVKFGSTAGSGISCLGSTTSCWVGSPAGTGSVHITATVAGVASKPTSADLYTYAIFPSVASVTPWNGAVTGGDAVTVTGTNFSTTGGTTIQFGTLAATGVSCSSSTQCTAIAPVRASSAGYLEVSVTATVNGHTSIQWVPFRFGTISPPPPPPPCKGTACK
jgi:hypothetical protein